MSNNPLSNENILKHLADALPTHTKDDTSSDLSSPYEAIALFAHACMAAVDFRLIGFREDQKLEEELRQISPRLSQKWNAGYGSISFLYAHHQSSMQYLVKVDKLGGKVEIRGIGLGDEKISRLEITAKDYVSPSALPLRITMTHGEEDRSDLESKLKDVYITPSRIQDFASLFKGTIIQKLIPGLHKEGYEEASNTAGASAARGAGRVAAQEARNEREDRASDRLWDGRPYPQPAQPRPFNDPIAAAPRRSFPDGPPPGFDDDYDIMRGPRYTNPLGGMAPPFGIGGDDLNPPGLGPHDPLRGSFVGGGGGPGTGGMNPSFDHPLFRGQGQGQGGFGGPDTRAPPGARFDPPYPGGPPQGGNGRPPNPYGGFGSNDFI